MVKSVPNSQFSSVNPDSSSVRKLLSDCDLLRLHFQILIHKSESILQFYFSQNHHIMKIMRITFHV